MVAFRRSDDDESLIVVLNFSPGTASVAVDADHASRDLTTDVGCVVTDGDGTERIRVDDVAIVREIAE